MTPRDREPLGFVVLDEDRYPMRLGQDDVLWIAHRLWTITAFATRGQAESAIRWTKRYERAHGYRWRSKYYIVRMVPFLRTPRKSDAPRESRGAVNEHCWR